MSKIERYLISIGKNLLFSNSAMMQNSGGKSFYNNGQYTLDTYQIIGTPYIIQHKSTGRAEYYLYKSDQLMGLAFNQKNFIENVLVKYLEI